MANSTGLMYKAGMGYFRTLKRTYVADHEEEAGRKRQKKTHEDKWHSRRHRVSCKTCSEYAGVLTELMYRALIIFGSDLMRFGSCLGSLGRSDLSK